jgi:hypothetical protein
MPDRPFCQQLPTFPCYLLESTASAQLLARHTCHKVCRTSLAEVVYAFLVVPAIEIAIWIIAACLLWGVAEVGLGAVRRRGT